MSDLNLSSPTSAPSSGASELSDLKALCADLQSQTHTLRIALLVVAGCLLAFFAIESRRSGQSLALLRPQAAQVAEATKQLDPAVTRFLGQLADYAKTHQDFAGILGKYISVSRPAGAPATGPAPVPAAPATATPKPAGATPVPAKK